MIRLIGLSVLAMLTLFSPAVQAASFHAVTVHVLNAPMATCQGTNGAGTYEWTETPSSTEVGIHGPLTITCTQDGFEPAMVTVEPVPDVGAEVLLFGVLGAAMLAQASGNLTYESLVKFLLKPDATASPETWTEYQKFQAQLEAEADMDEEY